MRKWQIKYKHKNTTDSVVIKSEEKPIFSEYIQVIKKKCLPDSYLLPQAKRGTASEGHYEDAYGIKVILVEEI